MCRAFAIASVYEESTVLEVSGVPVVVSVSSEISCDYEKSGVPTDSGVFVVTCVFYMCSV